MSSVSPILVKVSSSICLRMTAGIDEPLGPRHGNAEQGQRGQAGATRAHRVDRHHRLGRMAVAGRDGQHRAALAIGPDRLEQPGDRGDAVRRPGRVRVGLGAADRQVAQLSTEQFVGLAGENPRRVAVVLHNAPVVIDPENEGPDRRGKRGRHALGSDALGEGLLGFAYAVLLGVSSDRWLRGLARRHYLRFQGLAGPGRGSARHRSQGRLPRERCPSPTCPTSCAVS